MRTALPMLALLAACSAPVASVDAGTEPDASTACEPFYGQLSVSYIVNPPQPLLLPDVVALSQAGVPWFHSSPVYADSDSWRDCTGAYAPTACGYAFDVHCRVYWHDGTIWPVHIAETLAWNQSAQRYEGSGCVGMMSETGCAQPLQVILTPR